MRSNTLNTKMDNIDERKYFCPKLNPLNGIKLTNRPEKNPKIIIAAYKIKSFVVPEESGVSELEPLGLVLSSLNQRIIFMTVIAKIEYKILLSFFFNEKLVSSFIIGFMVQKIAYNGLLDETTLFRFCSKF